MDNARLRRFARDLRKNSTDAERHLWYYLRANRFRFKFKRQVPIHPFIVDFVCFEKRLIIELDGGQHQENLSYDHQRTNELNRLGFQVLRFWNHDVLHRTEEVLEVIRRALSPTLSRDRGQSTVQFPIAGRGG